MTRELNPTSACTCVVCSVPYNTIWWCITEQWVSHFPPLYQPPVFFV
jgi:hypothetical protein